MPADRPVQGRPCAPELLHLLRALARPGARAHEPRGGNPPEAHIAGSPSPIPLDPASWDLARREAWICPEGPSWRLTAAGRTALRRLLSTPKDHAPAANGAQRAPSHDKPGFNEAECPLTWLSRRKSKDGAPLIDRLQLEAGERLRADYTFAQLGPRVTASWSPTGGISSGPRAVPGMGVELADAVVAARERVNRALTAVGPELCGILIDVCCHLKGLEELERSAGWPQRSARIILLIALDSLARHYGIDRKRHPSTRTAPAAIRHWGAEGYRPAITTGIEGAERE